MPLRSSIGHHGNELLGRLPPAYRELVENLRLRRSALISLMEQDVAAAVRAAGEQVELTESALEAYRHDRLRLAAVRAYRNDLFRMIQDGRFLLRTRGPAGVDAASLRLVE